MNTSSTELSLRNELTRLVSQRERYELAAKAATNQRAKDRHGRTLQRLEDEIVGLQEALTSLTPLPIPERAPMPAPTPEPELEAATLKSAPAGAPIDLIKPIESWPIDTPPVRTPEPRSLIDAPRGPTRDSGLFAMPTALPRPDALARATARPDRWPERIAPTGELPRVPRPARPIATLSSIPPRRAPVAAPSPVQSPVSRPLPHSDTDSDTEADADAFDAVLLRRRITHQAAKVMTSAFAVGFVVAAIAFLSGRSDARTPAADPVLASSNNTP